MEEAGTNCMVEGVGKEAGRVEDTEAGMEEGHSTGQTDQQPCLAHKLAVEAVGDHLAVDKVGIGRELGRKRNFG